MMRKGHKGSRTLRSRKQNIFFNNKLFDVIKRFYARRFLFLIFSLFLIILLSVFFFRNISSPGPFAFDENDMDDKDKKVFSPVVEGVYYPSDPEGLMGELERFLDTSKNYSNATIDLSSKRIRAMIVPHAGYRYSGEVAGSAYSLIQERYYDPVFILAPSHEYIFQGTASLNYTHYSIPTGDINIGDGRKKLFDDGLFIYDDKAFQDEHSIEVQLPFIKKVLPDSDVIPILFREVQENLYAKGLLDHLTNQSLLVVSSDLSHFRQYDVARLVDDHTIDSILDLNLTAQDDCEACGLSPIKVLVDIARMKNWTPYLVDYKNSGDVTGKKDSVVGYASIIFYSDEPQPDHQDVHGFRLSEQDKKILLDLARDSIQEAVQGRKTSFPDENGLSETLKTRKGCFVTLEEDERLRGCIGSVVPVSRLYECVISNSINAAMNDPRFSGLNIEGLDDIDIEISVLTEPIEKDFDSPQELIDFLEPGVHGVILDKGINSATYLPSVWEQLPEKRDFLQSLCEKGGMDSDCWKSEDISIRVYRSIEFSEED